MSTIPLSGLDFYSILASSSRASHHPRAPSYSQRNDCSGTADANIKVSFCAVERDKSTKFKSQFSIFLTGHAWVLHLGLLEADLICNPCCSWPSSWKIIIDIGNMAVKKGLTVTPLAICDAAVLISLPLISFSFSVSGQYSSAMSRAEELEKHPH